MLFRSAEESASKFAAATATAAAAAETTTKETKREKNAEEATESPKPKPKASSPKTKTPVTKDDIDAKAAAAAALLREKKSTRRGSGGAAPAKTATEFERGCRTLRGKPEALSAFISALSVADVKRVVKESVSNVMLGAFAEAADKVWIPAGDVEKFSEYAAAVAALPRFAFNALLMSTADKAAMTRAFDAAGADERTAETRKLWKC